MGQILKLSVLLSAALILAGCPARKQTAEPAAPVNGRILIAQVQLVAASACPLCSRPVYSCPVAKGYAETFAGEIAAAFADKGFEVVKGKIPDKNAGQSPIAGWIELGKALNAKFVAVAELYCWKEREGSALASQSPARVGFHLHVFDPGTGKEIWGGNFHEQQQSLSEDILAVKKFVQRGGKWITAEQLAAEGVAKLIEQLIEAQKQNADHPVN